MGKRQGDKEPGDLNLEMGKFRNKMERFVGSYQKCFQVMFKKLKK